MGIVEELEKKYRVTHIKYSYVDKTNRDIVERAVKMYAVCLDSFAEIESLLECDFGDVFNLEICVREGL